MTRAVQGIYQFFEWLMKLAFINFLWLLFSACGLFLFGFFPATAALCRLVLKMINGDEPPSLHQTFIEKMKGDYWQSQLAGLAYTLFFFFLLFLWASILSILGQGSSHINWLMAGILYLSGLFYMFSLFGLIRTGTGKYLAYALFLIIRNPIHTLGLAVCLFIAVMLLLQKPVSLLFFGGSIPALINVWWVKEAYRKTSRIYENRN